MNYSSNPQGVNGAVLRLPRSNAPESQGIASSAILDFIEAVEAGDLELHSFMLLRHGKVAAEGWWFPYLRERPHMLFSLSKSFTATAAGLARAEGLLSLDDKVLSFFPEDAPEEVSENLAAMRVRDLLTMTTGHAEDTLGRLRHGGDSNWARAFLSQPVEHEPGTHFLYNSGATYMVSTIVQKATGQTVLNYLRLRLFEPLGITDPAWESCPRGINVGGWGLSVKTEDIARFGQLYLQDGLWNGVRLLPEGWVAEATARQVPNGDKPDSDWSEGYGYQFWRSRHNAYRGDGAFGQLCVVMPEQDAVLATTAGGRDMQAVLNLIWEHLLPAMNTSPLPEDTQAHERLRSTLSSLKVPPPEGEESSPIADNVSGRVYHFEPNEQGAESITFDFGSGCGQGRCIVRLAYAGREEHLVEVGGEGTWQDGRTAAFGSSPDDTARPVSASGAWTDEDTYVMRLCFTETPFSPTVTCRFEGDGKDSRLLLDYCANVAFGPRERPQLVARTMGR